MKTIGITGGVGAGKSQVLDYVKSSFCAKVLLADEVAHLIKEPGQPSYEKLVTLLGKDVLKEDGQIDKSHMAEKIFGDKELLRQVNELMHPAVKEYILQQIEIEREKGEVEFFFVEAALLIEEGYDKLLNEMWYIYAEDSIRRERLQSSRGYSPEKINKIMEKQLSDVEFRKHCRVVIDNGGKLSETHRQIDETLGGCQM